MVSHKNYYLSANEGFVIFLTSKLITCWSILSEYLTMLAPCI